MKYMACCPLFAPAPLLRCQAVEATEEAIAPSIYERERFCLVEGFVDCPTLRYMMQLGRRLEEREYLELWIPPRPGEQTAK